MTENTKNIISKLSTYTGLEYDGLLKLAVNITLQKMMTVMHGNELKTFVDFYNLDLTSELKYDAVMDFMNNINLPCDMEGALIDYLLVQLSNNYMALRPLRFNRRLLISLDSLLACKSITNNIISDMKGVN